jgi:peptide/nickel transport system substrate-binding protein
VRSLALLVIAALALAGATLGSGRVATAQGEIPKGGDLVIAIEGDVVAVDPVYAYDFTANPVVCEITEGLLKFDGPAVVPNLAESVENPDPLTWIYHLRQDVTFHDGTPMTADDVVFSMERTRDPDTASYVAWMYDSVDTIEKVDDLTVKVTLKSPDAFWQYVPATTAGHVISKAYFEANAETFGKPEGGVVGTGPFKFVSWTSGDQIALARNDSYWDKSGGPYLDTVTFKILTDPTTRTAGLQTGELSGVLGAIPGDQLPIVQQMDNVELQLVDSYLQDFIAYNTQRPPFDNATLRQALNYAVDKVGVRTTTLGEFATDARGIPVGPAMWTFNEDLWAAAYPEIPDYAFNLDTARTLLEESGVADQLDGKVITTDGNPVRLGQALALQAAAAELGHQLEINQLSFTDWITTAFGGARDYDILVSQWGSDFPDPAGNLLPVFASQNVGDGKSNFANYANADVDGLLNGQHAQSDNTARTEMMIDAAKLIAADSPWIMFDHPKQPFALNTQFTGYELVPLWYWDAFTKNIQLAQ